MTFAERLRYYREKAKYSQKELAAKIQIPFATYNNYETKGYEPKIVILIKLANALGIDVNTLLDFKKTDELQYISYFLQQADINIIHIEKHEKDTMIYYEHEDGIRNNYCSTSTALKIIENCKTEADKLTKNFISTRIESEFLDNPYLGLPEGTKEFFESFLKDHGKEFVNIITMLAELPPNEREEILNNVFSSSHTNDSEKQKE